MFSTIPLGLLALAISGTVDLGPARANCPMETEQGRRVVMRYATAPEFASIREGNGVPTATEDGMRLLTDPSDTAACRQITAAIQQRNAHGVSGYRPVYYTAGDYYYVALSRERRKLPPPPAGHARVSLGGWIPFYVLDREFKVVASAAM